MKLSVALAVLALVSLAQALADELGDNDELSYFADWSDGDPNKVRAAAAEEAFANGPGGWVAGIGRLHPPHPRGVAGTGWGAD